MGIKSAKKSNTVKTHSNRNYIIGGLLFPSYHLYDVLEMINKNLSLLHTETGEEYDYEPIFDSPARYSDDFDVIYDEIMYSISVFKKIYKNDGRVNDFLYNNRLSEKFSSLFGSIYNALIEAMSSGDNFDNEIKKIKNKKIKKIVRKLAHYGVVTKLIPNLNLNLNPNPLKPKHLKSIFRIVSRIKQFLQIHHLIFAKHLRELSGNMIKE